MIAARGAGRTSGRGMIQAAPDRPERNLPGAANDMAFPLSDTDFVPLDQCQFQRWGERGGPPFSEIRPLGEAAAERVWARAVALSSAAWARDGADADEIDLASVDGDEDAVKRRVAAWLRRRDAGGRPDEPVILCYQPRVAVVVPWRVVCDHWLVFFWTPGCAWPVSEDWVLVHDGDRFAFGRTPA